MNWPRVALGEVLSPVADRITLDPEQTYSQVTARLWGKGLAPRGVVKGSMIAASQQNRLRAGQFVISKIDARHGAFGIVPAELDGAVVSNDFPAFEINADRALPNYIAWIGCTDWFVALCKGASEGSTNRVRLKERRFLEQEVPLPPLDEQRRIVSRLDAATDAVATSRSAARAVEAEITATLRAAFVRISEGAPRARMGDIAPLVRRPVAIDPEASYPELGVRSFGRGLFPKPDLKGADLTWQALFRIDDGDLVFSNIKAWEGAFAIARAEHHGKHGSHRYLTCVPDPGRASAAFLWFYLQSEEGLHQISQASPGSADRNRTLATKRLEAITVPTPALGAQRCFDRLQTKAGAARAAQTEAATRLDRLLPAMLHEAFT